MWGKHSHGFTNVRDYPPMFHFKHFNRISLIIQACQSSRPSKTPAELAKMRRATDTKEWVSERSSSMALVLSGDMPPCQFCQHNVDWKRVDTCKSPLEVWSLQERDFIAAQMSIKCKKSQLCDIIKRQQPSVSLPTYVASLRINVVSIKCQR